MNNETITPESRRGSTPIENAARHAESSSQTEPHTAGAREEAERLKEKAESRLRSAAEEQKHFAAENIDHVARALHRSSAELEGEHQTTAARYMSWAAGELERVSESLREKDLQTVLQQTEALARRQPAIFFGGAVTTGFLLARFSRARRPATLLQHRGKSSQAFVNDQVQQGGFPCIFRVKHRLHDHTRKSRSWSCCAISLTK